MPPPKTRSETAKATAQSSKPIGRWADALSSDSETQSQSSRISRRPNTTTQKPQTQAQSSTAQSQLAVIPTKNEMIQSWVQSFQNTPHTALAIAPTNRAPQGVLETAAQKALDLNRNRQIVVSQNIPQNKQVVTTSSSSSQIISSQEIEFKSTYFAKTSFQRIMPIETGFFNENPRLCAQLIFLKEWHFQTWDIQKPREFYENILLDTGSVNIKNYVDKKNSNFITHATALINKVLKPSEWGENPNFYRKFPATILVNFKHATSYNYWDYKQAWFNTFLTQNPHFRHSWMFYFKTGIKFEFPIWFVSWWLWYGPIPEILPEQASKAFQFFEQQLNDNPKHKMFPALLKFFANFSLAWISAWEYDLTTNPHTDTPDLIRRFKVKWWDKFQVDEKINKQAIMNWLKDNPEQVIVPQEAEKEQQQFLAQKSKIQTLLAQAKNKEEYYSIMSQMLEQSDSASNKSEPDPLMDAVDLGDDNEDDCFGILPPIKQ